MRAIFCFIASVLIITSCGSTKKVAKIETATQKRTTAEGQKVIASSVKLQGIEMSEALNENGTKLIKVPYKWYLGIGEADNKQVAVEIAQREAYATISRILDNLVQDTAERGNVINDSKVQQALKTHWEMISVSVQRGCEPYGEVILEFNPQTKIYTAYAKVAIRGDKFTSLMDGAKANPSGLEGEQLQNFLDVNEQIISAAKQ